MRDEAGFGAWQQELRSAALLVKASARSLPVRGAGSLPIAGDAGADFDIGQLEDSQLGIADRGAGRRGEIERTEGHRGARCRQDRGYWR